MKNWFYRPSTNIEVIRSRHALVSILVDPVNQDLCKILRKSLRGVKNVPRILVDIGIGRSKLEDWKSLVEFFKCYKRIRETFDTLQGDKTHLHDCIESTFSLEVLEQTVTNIENIIDFDSSELFKRVAVQRNVDSELDRVRQVYDNIEESLAAVASEITQSIPPVSEPINVIYFPQLGYLIVLDKDCTHEVKELIDNKTWECIFFTDTHRYFKSVEMKEMDSEYGDLYGIICDHEIEITQSLQEETAKNSAEILNACNLCAQLDCHMAFADVALRNNYIRPEMSSENVLEIEMGVHPIYENIVSFFIPNNTSLADESEEKRIALLTGANYSGKTVYLTQCALLVYMAHIGSFIPAERATIGITDRILSRLSTKESVSKVFTKAVDCVCHC